MFLVVGEGSNGYGEAAMVVDKAATVVEKAATVVKAAGVDGMVVAALMAKAEKGTEV